MLKKSFFNLNSLYVVLKSFSSSRYQLCLLVRHRRFVVELIDFDDDMYYYFECCSKRNALRRYYNLKSNISR